MIRIRRSNKEERTHESRAKLWYRDWCAHLQFVEPQAI
jgi:hypothetical protein